MTTAQISELNHLQNELLFWKNKVQESSRKVVEKDATISCLEEQLDWFRRQLFGKKSEKIVSNLNDSQLCFDGFDSQQENATQEPGKTIEAHIRQKPNRNGQDKIKLPPDLPVVTVVLDIPEEQKVCQETGVPLVKIGEEVSLKLAQTPASYYIKEIIRPKYAHPDREELGVQTAELPESILLKCRADNSFLADMLVKKFADHLPLYRISEILAREGIRISRKLLSQWVVRCGVALQPLYNEMTKQILNSNNIFVDESPVNVLDKEKVKVGYMWVIVGGKAANPPYRVYGFSDRCYENLFKMIGDYRGGLHSDKYGAYQQLAEKKQITWYPCWSHIRRKFFEAEAGDAVFRKWVLRKIRYLFMLEKVAWSRSAEERLRIRREKEDRIIDELKVKILEKLGDPRLLPKSKFRGALAYFVGLIPYIKNYTENPFARLDNNVAERAIRPLALSRKNWLFFGSNEGGQSAAVILSLIQTCRGLGINPREYLEDIFGRLMSHSSRNLEELLPDQWLLNRKQTLNPTV
jgi:transposase